jgi:hypothetical protein
MYNSRLERRNNKRSQRQIVLYIIGSVVAAIILFVYGFPLLFGLTGAISNLGRKSVDTANKTIVPNKPEFSQNYSATFSATIKLTGFSDPKITVELFQNSRSLGTVVAQDDGSFSQEVDLLKGQNIFSAVAINEAGEKSAVSDSYSVSLLTTKPKLEVTVVDKTISGQTEVGNSITINDRLVIIDKDGKFSFTPNLNSGENKFTVTAVDLAGNQTNKELTIKN